MKMIRHQYVGVYVAITHDCRLMKRGRVELVVKVIAEANRAVNSSLNDMLGNAVDVDSRCVGNPWLSLALL